MYRGLGQKNFGLLIALISMALGIIGLVFCSYKTYAGNLTAGPLAVSYAGNQLFNESNLAPGDIVIKDLSVKNNGTLPHSFSMSTSSVVGNLASILQIEPSENGTVIWSETLANLASLPNGTKEIISSIPAGATRNLQIAAIFPASSGNNYQNQSVSFSMSFGNESTDITEPNKFTSEVDNSLIQRVSRVIRYNSTESGQPQNSVSTSPPTAAGGSEGISDAGVKGSTTKALQLCFWWLVIAVILIIFLIIYYRYLAKAEKVITWWIWPVFAATIFYFLQNYFDQYYQPTIFCHYFWVIEFLILVPFYFFEIRSLLSKNSRK